MSILPNKPRRQREPESHVRFVFEPDEIAEANHKRVHSIRWLMVSCAITGPLSIFILATQGFLAAGETLSICAGTAIAAVLVNDEGEVKTPRWLRAAAYSVTAVAGVAVIAGIVIRFIHRH